MMTSKSYSTELSLASSFLNRSDLKSSHEHLQSALKYLKTISTVNPSVHDSSNKENPSAETEYQTESIAMKPEAVIDSKPTSEQSLSSSQSSSIYPLPPSLTEYSGKIGRSAHTSPFNPSTPILPNSQVAYKPKLQPGSDWILCRVLRVLTEVKFEIQDPEPDDLIQMVQFLKPLPKKSF